MSKAYLLTKSDEEIIRAIQEQAHRHQMNYRGCCQIQVKALTDHLGFFSQDVFRAATPFAAGVARKGDQCGHLTGAIMVIGLYIGRNDLRESGQPKEFGPSPYSTSLDLSGELYDKFKGFWGTTKCFEIQEQLVGRRLDVTQPDVQKMVESGEYSNILSKVCCNVAASTAKMAAEILLREIRKEQQWYRYDQKPEYNYRPPKK
jgi:C_GCAxxG_C_C family probable redox protein